MAPTVSIYTVNVGVVQFQTKTIVFSIAESPVITGNPFLVFPIPGLMITVPDLEDFVWLRAKAILDPSEPQDGTRAMQMSLAEAGHLSLSAASVLDSSHAPTSAGGGAPICEVLLPPHSPGEYQAYASITSGTLRVLTPSHAPARLTWFVGREYVV